MPTLVELIDLLRMDAKRVRAEASRAPGRRRATDHSGGVHSDIAESMAVPNAVTYPGLERGFY
jgi:hypothetical protein